MFPGFRVRMEREVRRLASRDMEVENPVEYAWRGGASLAKDSEF